MGLSVTIQAATISSLDEPHPRSSRFPFPQLTGRAKAMAAAANSAASNGRFHKLGVLFMGVLITRALLVVVCIRAA